MDNNTSTNVNKNDLETVMKDLEQKVNPKSLQEGISRLNDSVKMNDLSILLEPMIAGSKEFESKIGRRMTYSEMRSMWG
jgi:Ca2+-binding EF-hand superfamily protein